MTSPNAIFAREIRAAMQRQGMSSYRLAEKIGIGEGPLSRFFNGKQGLKDTNLEAILDCLDLEIVIRKRRKRPTATEQDNTEPRP